MRGPAQQHRQDRDPQLFHYFSSLGNHIHVRGPLGRLHSLVRDENELALAERLHRTVVLVKVRRDGRDLLRGDLDTLAPHDPFDALGAWSGGEPSSLAKELLCVESLLLRRLRAHRENALHGSLALAFKHYVSFEERRLDFCFVDLGLRDLEKVVVEDDHVGPLAYLDRARHIVQSK